MMLSLLCREAFKIFDRDKDGFISMKELKKVCSMLGTMLTKEELDEFMAEADKVKMLYSCSLYQLCKYHIYRTEMVNWTTTSSSRCFSNTKSLYSV